MLNIMSQHHFIENLSTGKPDESNISHIRWIEYTYRQIPRSIEED